jgi:hypothetical protein
MHTSGPKCDLMSALWGPVLVVLKQDANKLIKSRFKIRRRDFLIWQIFGVPHQ